MFKLMLRLVEVTSNACLIKKETMDMCSMYAQVHNITQLMSHVHELSKRFGCQNPTTSN
jgi:hypothetical protein